MLKKTRLREFLINILAFLILFQDQINIDKLLLNKG